MMHSFLIARLTASFRFPYCTNTQIQLGSLPRHDTFLSFNSFTSGAISERESKPNQRKDDTFTVSYLINPCGLSPELAKKLSKKINLKNSDGPNAVLALLKNYGFSQAQISKLVQRRPIVLLSKAETTLLPKIKFFHSVGISMTDIPKMLIDNHLLLQRSLENCLIPRYEILRRVVSTDQEAVRALKRAARSLTLCDIETDLFPNITVLRQSGVPQTSISLLMVHHPGVACMKHSKFVEAVNAAQEFGFDPLKTTFIMAILVFTTNLNNAMLESKFKVFERWGWSHETAVQAFRKYPSFMTLSEERITKSMSFLVKDMGWLSEDVARYPAVITYSLEKRIIPRCSIIKILKSKGLVKKRLPLGSFISLSDEKFMKNFVTIFQEAVPLLPDVYKGLVNHLNVI